MIMSRKDSLKNTKNFIQNLYAHNSDIYRVEKALTKLFMAVIWKMSQIQLIMC